MAMAKLTVSHRPVTCRALQIEEQVRLTPASVAEFRADAKVKRRRVRSVASDSGASLTSRNGHASSCAWCRVTSTSVDWRSPLKTKTDSLARLISTGDLHASTLP